MKHINRELLFIISQDIIKNMEEYIFKKQNKFILFGFLNREFIFPLKYIQLGHKDIFRPFFKFSIYTTILYFILIFLTQQTDQLQLMNLVVYFSFFIPIFLVIFQSPVRYGFWNIDKNYIIHILYLFENNNMDTTEKINYFEKNINIFKDRIKRKINFYKWLIGGLWALNIFIFNIYKKQIDFNRLNINLTDLLNLPLSIFVLISIYFIYSYNRGLNIVLKSIELGCIEGKFQIETKKDYSDRDKISEIS